MNMVKLEKIACRGGVIYISSIDYDAMAKHLVIVFLRDAESHDIARILTFSEIADFSEEKFDDEDASIVDSLIGLDEYTEQQGLVRYVVHTELRELVFRTSEEPHVKEIP